MAQAYDLLVGDAFRRAKQRKYGGGKLSSNKTQATASVSMLDKDDEPWTVAVIVNQTEEGPRGSVLITMLLIASRFDDEGNLRGKLDTADYLAAARKFRSRLEDIGISKVMLNPQRCISWDEYEQIYTKAMEHDKGQQQKGENPAKGSSK